MPSGLTSDIYDGKDLTLGSFVRKCASQSFYDSDHVPSLDEIQKIYSGSSDRKRLEELDAQIAFLEKATDEEILKLDDEEQEQGRKRFREAQKERKETLEKYQKVRDLVLSWTPVVVDSDEIREVRLKNLNDLKGLCLRMLDESIAFDCYDPDPEYYFKEPRPVAEIREQKLRASRGTRDRCLESLAKSEEGYRVRMWFVRDLDAQFPRPPKE